MKPILLFSLFCLAFINLKGQVVTSYIHEKTEIAEIFNYNFERPKATLDFKIKDEVNIASDQYEDECFAGIDQKVNFSLQNGKWQETKGGSLWSVTIKSDGVKFLALTFDFDRFSDNAELFLMNPQKTIITGPIKKWNIPQNGYLRTHEILGEEVDVVLFEPKNEKGKTSFVISEITYKSSGDMSINNEGDASSCNNDISCYPDLKDEALAVVRITNGGRYITGTLIANTNNDFKPLILTVFHGIDIDKSKSLSKAEFDNLEEATIEFNAKSKGCNGAIRDKVYTYTGVKYLSGYTYTDFALLELKDPIKHNAVWLGWDRTENSSSSGVCIHHPKGDLMKVSFERNRIGTASKGFEHIGKVNLWEAVFDSGITEKGSSGSALINSQSRILGQLVGSPTVSNPCNDKLAWYGKLSKSWFGGGTSTTRLKNWLDPENTGQTTIDSKVNYTLEGPDIVCSEEERFEVVGIPDHWIVYWEASSPAVTLNRIGYGHVCKIGGGLGAITITAKVNDTRTRKSFYLTKDIWFGKPEAYTLKVNGLDILNGIEVCPGTNAILTHSLYSDNAGVTSIDYDFPSGFYEYNSSDPYRVNVYVPNDFYYAEVPLTITNACGSDVLNIDMFTNFCGAGYSMSMSPNPSTGVTTLSLDFAELPTDNSIGTFEANSNLKSEDEEWEYEVFSLEEGMKLKKKLKGKTSQINTSGWKAGVYIVRVNYNGELLSGKLIVK